MKSKFIFDKWKPNMTLLVIAYIIYSILVLFVFDIVECLCITIAVVIAHIGIIFSKERIK